MIQFTETAKKKILEFIQGSGKAGIALRVSIKSRSTAGFVYDFQLEDYGAERPNDVIVREGGFATRIDPESAKYLKGSVVDWLESKNATGFAVNNPNIPRPAEGADALKQNIIETLKTIFDPEIPVNIYELGLIYEIEVDQNRNVSIKMTLTAPNCPAAEQLPAEVESKTKAIVGVNDVKLTLVWEPPWNKDMISEAARLQLGL